MIQYDLKFTGTGDFPSATSLFVVTAGIAFKQGLDVTLEQVEREIVLAVQRHTGNVPHAIAQILKTAHGTFEKHLGSIDDRDRHRQLHLVADRRDQVIYRAMPGIIFARPLQTILEEVEHAIFRAAYHRFGKEKVRSRLRLGHERCAPASRLFRL